PDLDTCSGVPRLADSTSRQSSAVSGQRFCASRTSAKFSRLIDFTDRDIENARSDNSICASACSSRPDAISDDDSAANRDPFIVRYQSESQITPSPISSGVG